MSFSMSLLQGLYPDQLLLLPGALPIGQKFRLVQCCPFYDKPEGPWRQPPVQDGQGLNVDDSLQLAIAGVEVRRRVIVIVHQYDDPKETTDLWHSCFSSPSFPQG